MRKNHATLSLVHSFDDFPAADEQPFFVGAHTPDARPQRAPTDGAGTDRHRNPNKARISLWPDSELLAKFKHHAHSNGLSFTEAFEIAAEQIINTERPIIESVGARPHAGTYDTDLDDLKPIIDLYFEWTAAYNAKHTRSGQIRRPRWYDADTNAARKLKHIDIRIIELGIITTLNNANGQHGAIKWFRYYVPGIYHQNQTSKTLKPDTLATMHNHHRTQMKKHLGVAD
jgi:hypothetical protein